LTSITNALVPGGIMQIATDQHDYFDAIQQLAKAAADLKIVDAALDRRDVDLPRTKFEQIFQQKGVKIYRLELRKT
ncbi:MAG: hypothetical protein LC627_03195, partial [Verrucomicrobiaceae bacterium]|nr:hypothetical protein [Verrucomicrobiaceae bacterium]